MGEITDPMSAWFAVRDFLETGGEVLLWIMALTFLMWTLIVERYWYFFLSYPRTAKRVVAAWRERSDKTSWRAEKIRTAMVSDVRLEAFQYVDLIKTCVAVAPLFGLLGTVTGMVEVFDVLAFTGASNVRAMASGVSKATIPTMAGMVAALSGLYLSTIVESMARRRVERVEDQLTTLEE